MSFPLYAKRTDSGIDWLGLVPDHWAVKRLKHLAAKKKFAIVDGPFGTQLKADDYQIGGVPLIRISNLSYQGLLDIDDLVFISPDKAKEVERSSVKIGDVVVGKTGATIGKCALVTHFDRAIIASSCLKMSPDTTTLIPAFLLFCIVSDGFQKTLINESGGSTRDTINITPFGNLAIAVPPLAEQAAIINFLERETAKIDALISEQERLIQLLKEKRQAVISHAVTKGLNRNAPMKPSGIEWLGDVPAHWAVASIKFYCGTITDGAHISPETENGVYPFVSTKDVGDEVIDIENSLRTSPASFEYMVKTGCQPQPGDVLFSKDGTIGRTIVVAEIREFVVASSLIIIRPDSTKLDPHFLHRLCQSQAVNGQVASFTKGAGLPRLSIQNLLKVIGCFPPLSEQQAIAAFLNEMTSKYDALTKEAQHAIEILQERRTALISAAVTGQIDVRGLVQAEAA